MRLASNSAVRKFIALLESDRSLFFGQSFVTIVVFGFALCTFILGVVYATGLGNILRFPDETSYVSLTKNLVSNNSYSLNGTTPTAIHPPGYSFIMYPIFLLGGDVVHVRVVQFFFFALSIFLVHKLLYAWSYHLASFLAGFLAFCYPVLFYTAGTLYPQTATALLFLLVCYFVIRPQTSLVHWVFGSITFACLVLTTPTFLVLLPLLLVWPQVLRRRHAFLANIVLLVVVVAVISPWTLRNYLVFDRFVPFSTNTGVNLLIGNSEHAQPNAGTTTDISTYRDMAMTQGFSEVERDAFYRSEAFRWIVQNKIAAAKLYILKFLTHFHFRNDLRTRAESNVRRDAIMFVTYYTLLILATWRVFTGGSLTTRPFEAFAVVSYLMMGAVYAIFFTRIRFRLPVDWMLIVLASISVAHLLGGLRSAKPHRV